MKQKNGGWIALFLAPACILFILIFAIPLVMVFVTSLFDYRLLPRTFTFVGFSNFVQLFTEDNRFWPIFGNTVKWLFIMIPNIISQSAIAMIFLNLYNAQYGAVNSFLKLVGLESLQHNWLFETATAFPSVTLTWFLFAGYTTTLVLAQLLSTDESLIEAAEIDGATSFQIDRLVMFPVVKKMIGTTVIMAATYMLQLFSMLYITTGGGPGTVTTNLPLYLYTTMKANNYGYANTIGVVIILLGFITMTLIRKIFGMNKED